MRVKNWLKRKSLAIKLTSVPNFTINIQYNQIKSHKRLSKGAYFSLKAEVGAIFCF